VYAGSGGLSIGQAGEFDYSGSQAIKALQEEKIKTVLINPNIATVQTSQGLADRVYFLPVTPEWVTKIIELERPDGLLLQFGGQTALNCGIELYRSGVLVNNNVAVLGTSVDTIIATEDREIFAQKLTEIDEKIAPSVAARSLSESIAAADRIGYPVIVRAGFALGGLGSGFAYNQDDLVKIVQVALASSEQVLVEKSLKGWKEIEYEVVRDSFDNCITVCNMENFDPLGIHTGESIVVAPSQTLTDEEYNILRNTAIKVVRHLGVVGECNIQYALDPASTQYYIIEVNARLSRSSALASKATGYPLAFVAAKLALGHPLPKLRNSTTKSTTACFEPSLDYCVVKIPRWDLKKFSRVSTLIGTSMKSVGEVMAIGRRFEEAMQKAIRMVNPSVTGFQPFGSVKASEELLRDPTDQRIYVIADAMRTGYGVDKVHDLTKIDKWFLHKLQNIVNFENGLRERVKSPSALTREVLLEAKQLGFSDKQIAKALNSTELIIRKQRHDFRVLPCVKQIDTVAAEFPATNNYLYMTYNGFEDDVARGFPEKSGSVAVADEDAELDVTVPKSVVVLGSGAYCIGSSVEFDWCAVNCIRTLRNLGHKTIMINYNPETVSTDYDECDKLYFEELTFERVVDIYEREEPDGVVVSMGGQIPNNLATPLQRAGVHIFGTATEAIESAENRYKFSRLLDTLGVDQPKWKECRNLEETRLFCEAVGYPCLVRPSFVLSGAGMNVVNTFEELSAFLATATEVSRDHPVVISKFITNAKEIDYDGVSLQGSVVLHAISEHVENAGVHSGDATLVLPAQDLDDVTVKKVQDAAAMIAKALNISGPFNIQFIAKDNEIKVIECNVRASRSFPFVSKTLLQNFAETATKALLGLSLVPISIDLSRIPHVGVKVPQFSFTRLQGADPVLGVEMASTGEVACFGETKFEAYMKALLATGLRWPKNKNVLISLGAYKEKLEFLPSAKKLVDAGYSLFGTPGTADFFSENDVPTTALQWPHEATEDELSVDKHLANNMIDICFLMPSANRFRRPSSFMSRGYRTRRLAVDFAVPLITNIKCAKMYVEALIQITPSNWPIKNVDSRSKHRTVVLPGLVEVHAHLREPGQEYKEDFDSGTAAALAGGYTQVLAMPNTRPSITDHASQELALKLASEKARCDYGVYAAATDLNVATLPSLAPRACAAKMYCDETFGNLKISDLAVWYEVFRTWPRDKPLCVHAEQKSMASAILMAHLHDRHVHICHISLREEILVIKAAKAKGIRVSCEVCPHHLFLSKDDERVKAMPFGRTEVRPRLAAKSDVDALWENIDHIDIIATDHAPHTVEEKDSDKPPPGFPGMETALALMLTAVNEGKLTLEKLVEKMAHNPRRIFNLPEQPDTHIEVDLDHEWVIPEAMAYSKCKWTPFAGMSVVGKVHKVVLRGEVAYLDGKVYAKPGTGRNVALGQGSAAPSETVAPVSPVAPPSPVRPKRSRSKSILVSSLEAASVSGPLTARSSSIAAAAPLHLGLGADGRNTFKGRSIISANQFNRADLHHLFTIAEDMKLVHKRVGSLDVLRGKMMATLFYEPSTRTYASFFSAMSRLGGMVVPIQESSSSAVKGESLADTVRTLSSYCDVIVLRHPAKGAAAEAAAATATPIINAGDGAGEHPTQALLDVFTIRQELGTVNNLNIVLVGDLKNGRTVHSLVKVLALYKVNLTYVSPASLQMPSEIVADLKSKGIQQTFSTDIKAAIVEADVVYVTRIQKERFADIKEYEAVRGSYQITTELLQLAKEHMVVMHPLPRNEEIHPDVDTDPRAAYFRQTENGMYIRMALLTSVLGADSRM
jgi:carbamoyl-phosphate synthase / aspartate carbamoyltransferase / dihydroorotase